MAVAKMDLKERVKIKGSSVLTHQALDFVFVCGIQELLQLVIHVLNLAALDELDHLLHGLLLHIHHVHHTFLGLLHVSLQHLSKTADLQFGCIRRRISS